MAIKIIKEGRKKKAVYRAKCSNCDCEFEFNKEDAFFGKDMGGKYWNINCPHCKVRIHSWHVDPCRYEMIEGLVEEETSTKFEKHHLEHLQKEHANNNMMIL